MTDDVIRTGVINIIITDQLTVAVNSLGHPTTSLSHNIYDRHRKLSKTSLNFPARSYGMNDQLQSNDNKFLR